jgi:hypothetical protein
LSEIVVAGTNTGIVASTPQPQHRYEDLRLMAEAMSKSGFFKEAKDFNRAITIALVGQELGIPPATSIMGIHIIEGKPSMSANLMASQLKKSGKYNYRVRENTAKVCRIAFFEMVAGTSEEIGLSEFTIEEAAAAGLSNKQVWRQYPKSMLFNRALSQGVRTFCPDAFGGSPVYYEGEIEESMQSRLEPDPEPIQAPESAKPKGDPELKAIRAAWGFDTPDWTRFLRGRPIEVGAEIVKAAHAAGIMDLDTANQWDGTKRAVALTEAMNFYKPSPTEWQELIDLCAESDLPITAATAITQAHKGKLADFETVIEWAGSGFPNLEKPELVGAIEDPFADKTQEALIV